MNRSICISLTSLIWLAGSSRFCHADTFGSGANTFQIDFVRIGNPGNAPDANPNPAGAVPYEYRIGKFEISEQMIDKANALGTLSITKDTRGPHYPATSVTWYEAARFVNWLNTSTGSVPAYKFDASGNFQLWQPLDSGYDSANLYRNTLARYFLPSLNEWHKAAYYDPVAATYYDYPTGSDAIPDGIDVPADPIFDAVFFDSGDNGGPNILTNVGILSPYGTAAQGGNVEEWIEGAFDRTNDRATEQRGLEGGGWNWSASLMHAANTSSARPPTFDQNSVGLRVSSIIPEPSTIVIGVIGSLALLWSRITRRFRR